MFKSVKIIQQAVITGWSALIKRERIGTIISAGEKPLVYQPQANERHYLAILNELSKCSSLRPPFQEQDNLRNLLLALQQQVRSGHLVFIYSDFLQFDAEIEKLITHLAHRAQVILNFVYDPFEAVPPPPNQYLLTNGQKNLLFDMQDARNRTLYQQQFAFKVQQLKNFSRQHGMTLHLYCTDAQREVEA